MRIEQLNRYFTTRRPVAVVVPQQDTVSMNTLSRRAVRMAAQLVRTSAGLGRRIVAHSPRFMRTLLSPASSKLDSAAVVLDRAESRGWYDDGLRFLAEGSSPEAVEALLRAAEIGPQIRSVVQRFNDHESLYRLAGSRAALSRMRDIAARRPDVATAQLHVGAFLIDQGYIDEGREAIQRGYRLQLRETESASEVLSDDGAPVPPSFVILGPHKSGTTSLHSWLCEHSRVIPPVRKEIQFWSNRRGRPLEAYEAYFPPLRSGFVTGEASASYLHLPGCASDVARHFPEVKTILLRRDPVARTYSHYQLFLRQQFHLPSFEMAVAAELEMLGTTPPLFVSEIDRVEHSGDKNMTHPPAYGGASPLLLGSCLLPFVRMWSEALGPEKVMVVDLDYLSRERHSALASLLAYLELPAEEITDLRSRNVAEYKPSYPSVEERLREWFAPHEKAFDAFLASHPAQIPRGR